MLIKTMMLACVIAFLIFIAITVYAWFTKTMFVLDASDSPSLPRKFRAMFDISDMHIAGGGQFSQAGFATILKTLDTKQLTVIDLRQELHGFLNEHAVSWFGVYNADNRHKSTTEIENIQAKMLAQIAQKKNVKVACIEQKTSEGRIEKLKPISMSVQSVISEGDWLKQQGHQYFRIYVQDYHAPTPNEVDRFIMIFKQLPKDQWVYFHCRAGIGRTTVFMTLYDMMLHAKQTSFNQIIDRQVVAGGKDLRKLIPKTHYKYQWHKDRLDFMKEFYQYARENQDAFETSFSEWQAKPN